MEESLDRFVDGLRGHATLPPYLHLRAKSHLLKAESNIFSLAWGAGQILATVAITLIPDAQPFRGGQKGADTGIDGIVYLRTGKSKTDKAIIEVKGGGVSVDQVHKLKSVIERENAIIGLFLTLKEPTRPMVAEAASAGFVEIDVAESKRFPRLQILTIDELLNGVRPHLPIIDSTAFRKARREERKTQEELDI